MKRAMTIKALEEVKIIALSRQSATQILGDKVQIIVFRNI